MLDIEQFVEKKNSLGGDAFLMLVEIEYADGQFFRVARNATDVTFEGQTWVAFGISKPRRSQNARAEIPTFDLVLANPQRIFGSVLANYIVEGRTGRLITVDRDQLDDPNAKAEEWFEVQFPDVHEKAVTLTCRPVRFNPRQQRIPSATMTRGEYPGLAGASVSRYS